MYNPYPQFNPQEPQYNAQYSLNYPQYGVNNYQSSQQGNILWAQGEAGAKACAVKPGTTAVIFDSEKPIFYIKTVDQSGIPQPLKIYDFTERKPVEQKPIDLSEYVKKSDLQKYLEEMLGTSKGGDSV